MHLRKVLKHFIINGCPSYCSIMSHLSCSEGTKILHFMFNLRADLDRKLHSATHMWERDTVRSISYLPYVSHKVLKYFMSNGWHSLQCSIPFAVLNGCLSEIWCFGVCNLRVDDHGNRQIKTHMWLTEAVRSFFPLYCASKDGFETLHKLWLCLSVIEHPLCLIYWEGTNIWHFLVCNLRVYVRRYRHNVTHSWQTDVVRSTSHLPHVPESGSETLHEQWLLLLVVHHLICHTERVPKSCILG